MKKLNGLTSVFPKYEDKMLVLLNNQEIISQGVCRRDFAPYNSILVGLFIIVPNMRAPVSSKMTVGRTVSINPIKLDTFPGAS